MNGLHMLCLQRHIAEGLFHCSVILLSLSDSSCSHETLQQEKGLSRSVFPPVANKVNVLYEALNEEEPVVGWLFTIAKLYKLARVILWYRLSFSDTMSLWIKIDPFCFLFRMKEFCCIHLLCFHFFYFETNLLEIVTF